MKLTTLLATISAFVLSAEAIHITNKAGHTHLNVKLGESEVKNEALLAQTKAGCDNKPGHSRKFILDDE